MQDTRHNEKKFTADELKDQVSISVDCNYWVNKESRMLQDLADLYTDLFPKELGRQGLNEVAKQRLRAASADRARALWRAIKANPKNPPGPLTLAAISKAIAEGADFNDFSDRHAFFIFMQHNSDFQKLYHFALKDNVVRASDEGVIELLRTTFPDLVPSEYEAIKLAKLWFGDEISKEDPGKVALNSIIRTAMQARDFKFNSELFEYAPAAVAFFAESDSPETRKIEALKNPGVVEAASLGFEPASVPLNEILKDKNSIVDLFAQEIYWTNVYVAGHKAKGKFTMEWLFGKPHLDSDAFIAQVVRSKLNISPNGYHFSVMMNGAVGYSGEELQPDENDTRAMVEQMAKVVCDGLTYFISHRREEIIALITQIANVEFRAETNSEKFHECRFRLYHPVTIRMMEKFWLENFDAFMCAAGKNDQYLGHLLQHMSNPAAFLLRILRDKSSSPVMGTLDQRRAYLAPRLVKLLPLLSRIPGVRAQKDFTALLEETIISDGAGVTTTVRQLFKARVAQLIDNYARHFVDPGDELFSILDAPITRDLAELSAGQVQQCLGVEEGANGRSVHSRIEVNIALDDELMSKIQKPTALLQEEKRLEEAGEQPEDNSELSTYKALYPTIWARFRVSELVKSQSLSDYVEASKKPRPLLAGPVYEDSVREAYIIASTEECWQQIDPYARHSLRTFSGWGFGNQEEYFEEKKKSLQVKNPIFAIRMEWEENRQQSFDQFLVEKLCSLLAGKACLDGAVISNYARLEMAMLVADIGRSEDLFELYRSGELQVPQNPCRTKAFLAQINTPEKAAEVRKFVLQIDPANIDAEAIFRLMLRGEGQCFDLANELLKKNKALLKEVILLHLRSRDKLPHYAIERLMGVIRLWINDETVVTPQILQELLRNGLLKNEFSADMRLLRRLISIDVPVDLIQGVKGILLNDRGVQSGANGGHLREKLTAEDLFKLKDVMPSVFNQLMGLENNYLRKKLFSYIAKLKNEELENLSLNGLEVFFRKEPQVFYELLLRLPAHKLNPPVEWIGTEREDIFGLQKEENAVAFMQHMRKIDFLRPDDINLVMRCLNSKNSCLVGLMTEVFLETINGSRPELVADILVRYLIHPQANESLIQSVLVDGANFRPAIMNVLVETDFVSKHLNKDRNTKKFSENAMKLWSVLDKIGPLKSFLAAFTFEGLESEQLKRTQMLSRLYDDFLLKKPKPETVLVAAQIGQNFGEIFSNGVDQRTITLDKSNGIGISNEL